MLILIGILILALIIKKPYIGTSLLVASTLLAPLHIITEGLTINRIIGVITVLGILINLLNKFICYYFMKSCYTNFWIIINWSTKN